MLDAGWFSGVGLVLLGATLAVSLVAAFPGSLVVGWWVALRRRAGASGVALPLIGAGLVCAATYCLVFRYVFACPDEFTVLAGLLSGGAAAVGGATLGRVAVPTRAATS